MNKEELEKQYQKETRRIERMRASKAFDWSTNVREAKQEIEEQKFWEDLKQLRKVKES
jgi:hypothetical protein